MRLLLLWGCLCWLAVEGVAAAPNGHAAADQLRCRPGEHFTKQCNSCVCSADGVTSACTKMMCPTEDAVRPHLTDNENKVKEAIDKFVQSLRNVQPPLWHRSFLRLLSSASAASPAHQLAAVATILWTARSDANYVISELDRGMTTGTHPRSYKSNELRNINKLNWWANEALERLVADHRPQVKQELFKYFKEKYQTNIPNNYYESGGTIPDISYGYIQI